MHERLLGMETEYAFSAVDSQGRPVDRKRTAERLINVAREILPSLPAAQSSGMFLANGARLYLDAGFHPEFSTPECMSPSEVIRYQLAGDRILDRLGQTLVANYDEIADVVLTRCNVDYSGSWATWGCHESYLHRVDSEVVARHIIPHFVSRIIYTGAGGFDNRTSGVKFLVSPRVPHLRVERSCHSTYVRGIFHEKDESLCGRAYHRLHVLCGESSCSHLAGWLKLGTTALVLAMIEAGLRPARGMQLVSTVSAMQEFAADPYCGVKVPALNGEMVSALDIQRHYLVAAETHLGDGFMPPWAADVCAVWRATLDEIERGDAALGRKLDWAIKRMLFVRHAGRRGFDWTSLGHWTEIADRLVTAVTQRRCREEFITAEEVLGPNSPVPEVVERLRPVLEGYGLCWDGLRPFLNLKKELFEIDTRYSQVGERGIFQALDRAQLLSHDVPTIGDVEGAVEMPPASGRAHLRGRAIRALAERRVEHAEAEWHAVWDRSTGRVLDLSEPFVERARWRSMVGDDETDLDWLSVI